MFRRTTVFLAAALAACVVCAQHDAEPPAAPGGDPFAALSFRAEVDVLRVVGQPAARRVEKDRVCWYYRQDVLDSFGRLCNVELQLMDGEVRAVLYWPKAAMDDKIATARLVEGWQPPTGPRGKAFTFDEASAVAIGKRKADIVARFGEPNSKRIISGNEVWQYDDLVFEDGVIYVLAIQFEGDVAVTVESL